jgi:adenosylcobinamide kinase/adenosylcobinamide-phosphate guanylyltransferase
MGEIILVTGGARSGKSTFAEDYSLKNGGKVAYIATAIPFDNEMKERIKIHQQRRCENFETIERYKDFKSLDLSLLHGKEAALIDCVTVMITNIMMDYLKLDIENDKYREIEFSDLEPIEKLVNNEIQEMIELLKSNVGRTIIVTNELGMGIIPDNFFARLFRDVAGKINQNIAKISNEVYFCVSGIPLKIK